MIVWTFSEQPEAGSIVYNLHKALEPGDKCMAGICRKKGNNAHILSQCLNFVMVKNLGEDLENCQKLERKTIDEPRNS